MATVTPTKLVTYDSIKYTWTGMVTGDTIVAQQVQASNGDRSVQASGTFAGGTVIGLNGSNIDGGAGTYFVLTDPQGNNISARTAAFGEQITEITQWIQPTIGSGSADSVTVNVFISRTKKGSM
jgi:hypothetical protein